MDKLVKKIVEKIKKRTLAFMMGFVFAILCFIGLSASIKLTSTSEYCGSKCHEMNTAYQTWEISRHGSGNKGIRVECIDCHLPPKDKFFKYLAAKVHTGAKDIYKHYFGDEYNSEQMIAEVMERMSNDMCLRCHDNLSVKSSNSAARIAHMTVLADPESPDSKCLGCHEEVAHQRSSKLFSP